MKKFLLTFSIFILIIRAVTAQMGINTETPNDLTVLDIQNNTLPDGSKIPKGVMVPRLTETQRDAITIPTDSIANSLLIYNTDEDCYNYYSRKEKEWQSLCGKMGSAQFVISCNSNPPEAKGIYGKGVATDNSNYLKVTVYVTKPGSYTISAISSPDNGYFFEASGTFLSKDIYVTLHIPATGQPIKDSQGADLIDPADDTPDHFTLVSNGGGSECDFYVSVQNTDAHPLFEMECGSWEVIGKYFEDSVLKSAPVAEANRIKVKLKNIPSSAYGSWATLQTNTVDGISFSGKVMLTPTTTDVYLQGTGTPRGLNDKIMTIVTNSESSSTSCIAVVHMLIPQKRLMALGQDADYDAIYGYNPARNTARNPKNSFNTLLTDKDNFGHNQWSILKFAGFNNVGIGISDNFVSSSIIDSWADDGRDIIGIGLSAWRTMSAAKLESILKGSNGKSKIDIFMIAYTGLPGDASEYYRTGNDDDRDRCRKLVDFVKSGGILMICSELPVSNGNFLKMLFNDNSISSSQGHGAGTKYTLGFNADNIPASMKPYYCKDDDPILRGPFEDITGKVWGEDASTTIYVQNLPLDEIIIYSGARSINDPMNGTGLLPADGVSVFRHKEYPFVFVGDAGFNSSETRGYSVADNHCPFQLTTKTIKGRTYNNYPTFRNQFGASNTMKVYNAQFTANAFAWCIYQAEQYHRTH
jgi:hypothetical protein